MTKITKEDLAGRGIEIPELKKRYTLKHSWHVPEKVKFAGEAETQELDLDTKKKIKKGDFVSIGHREIEPDDPIKVDGLDIVHWNAAFEGTLGEVLKKFAGDVRKIEGFNDLTEEQKLNYLKEAGQATAEELKKLDKPKQAFTGVNAVLAGGFEDKDAIVKKIEDNGGKVISNVTKACNLLVLGRSWTTKTRTKVGKGSPKHREAVKKGAKIVKRKWLDKAVDTFKKSGKTALEQDAPPQPEMDAESDEERQVFEKKEQENKRKREAASSKDADEPAAKKQKKPIPEESKLKSMKRNDLQALCKEHGIKASGTNEEMVKKLVEATK